MSNEVTTVYDELKHHIRDVLSTMNNVSIDNNGFYYSECYKDYNDELDDATIAEFLKSSDPMSQFEEHLLFAYDEAINEEENHVVDELKGNQDIIRIMNKLNISDDDLREHLREVWCMRPPYEDFLNQEVCMDIMLDTGDANYEFTLNDLASNDIEIAADFDDNSSLLWLCEQQGVTRTELLAAFDKGTAHSDEAENLMQRRNDLVEKLKKYGFSTPRFNESVIHTGAYREYIKLQDEVLKRQSDIKRLETTYEINNISYHEYLKKHFDMYQRLDPMTEEKFNAKKAEILSVCSERIAGAKALLKVAEEKLANRVDLAEVANIQSEYMDVNRQLSELSKTDEFKKAKFINSVHNEIINTYGRAVVTFLVKMPLESAIKLQDIINSEEELNNSYCYEERKGLSSITLDKNVSCGLMDDWNGKGSVFGLKLLNDVEIPIKAIFKAGPDRQIGGYGYMSIYGENDESFTDSLKRINEVSLNKVEDLIADASSRAVESNDESFGKDSYELE